MARTTTAQTKTKEGATGSTAVAAQKAAGLPAGMDDDLAAEMAANADQRQVFDARQLTIPRLVQLQDLSPQVKPNDGEYIEGAIPGLLCNQLRRTVDEFIEFVPAKFGVRWIAWRPRKDGGGLVDQNLTLQECEENFTPDGIGRFVGRIAPREGEDAVKVEIIETPEWVGYARSVSFDWCPVAISFPSTKAKVVKKMNSIIDLTEMEVNGQVFTPAPFFHLFRIGSFLDRSGSDTFYNFTVDHLGWCQDARVRAKAKELKKGFETGEAVVEEAGSPS